MIEKMMPEEYVRVSRVAAKRRRGPRYSSEYPVVVLHLKMRKDLYAAIDNAAGANSMSSYILGLVRKDLGITGE